MGAAPRSVATLLEQTDMLLRRGERAGATVWSTGFPLLDEALGGGLRSGELALLGGPQGNGKTMMGLQFVRNVVRAGRTGIIFSYEHQANTLMERLISLEAAESDSGSAASVLEVRRGLETGTAGGSLEELLASMRGGAAAYAALRSYGDRLHIHESSGASTTLNELRAVITDVHDRTGQVPFVLVDYLQKIPVDGASEDERITGAVEGVKDLALDLGVPVVAVSAADKASLAAGRRMRTHDLRGASALAFEADVVMILSDKIDVVSRDHLVYDLANIQRFREWSVLTLEKNRHGRGDVELEFGKDFEHGRFITEGREVRERLIDERIVVS
ncbi:helicase DnaB [Intrasporangium chromatireducens Q5-1]|uniref:Helicase DnaB n=1 Tax=Intrasporangium chromatireducens Q5-1 TaxID=584657 RepID=W9GQI6_9MICO|nr:helicase DnaB [Intrasporangium chromatireducens Q5-1]